MTITTTQKYAIGGVALVVVGYLGYTIYNSNKAVV